MTKSKGILIGILLLLIAVLTGIMVWGIARGGGLRVELGKFFSGDAKLVNEQSIDTEGLQEVSVIYRSADLVLTVSDTNALTIEEYMTGDPGEENFADIQRDDAAGSLSVTEGKSYTAVSFLSFGSGQQYVEIGVPEDYRGTLRLKTGSGNIMLTELNMEQLDISADSGDITLLDTGAKRLECTAGSGNVNINGSEGNLTLTTGSGDVYVSGIEGNLQMETGSGDQEVQGCSGSVRTKTGSGDVYMDDIGGSVNAETGSGDVRLTGMDEQSFTLKVDTTAGDIDCDIDGELWYNEEGNSAEGTFGGSSDRQVQIRTGSGDVSVL